MHRKQECAVLGKIHTHPKEGIENSDRRDFKSEGFEGKYETKMEFPERRGRGKNQESL